MSAQEPVISGGVPAESDVFACSIFLFAYVICLVLTVKKMLNKSTRWLVLDQRSLSISLERIVLFGLRIGAVVNPSNLQKIPYISAMDGMAFLGWISCVFGLIDLMRYHSCRSVFGTQEELDKGFKWTRLFHFFAFLGVPVGIVSTIFIAISIQDPSKTPLVDISRYIPLSILLVTIFCIIFKTMYDFKTADRPEPLSAMIILGLCSVLIIVPVYRISAVPNRAESVFGQSPTSTRAMLYVFQSLPEYVLAMIFILVDMKSLYGGRGKWYSKPGRYEDDSDNTPSSTGNNMPAQHITIHTSQASSRAHLLASQESILPNTSTEGLSADGHQIVRFQ